jgi:hypothetical protein
MQEHFTSRASFSANGDVLPTIEEVAVMEGTHFLEDMESILEGITPAPLTALEECLPKPRSRNDLTALMSGIHRKDHLQQQTPRFGLRRRLETYLEEEVAKAYQEEVDREETVEEGDQRQEANESDKPANDSKHVISHEPPIVWVIHPCHGKDGTLRFKFSTDGGACLILKDKEALESVGIMKESSCNTFFQVYTIQGGVSRIVKPDQISRVMEEILSEAKPAVNEEDIPTYSFETEHKVKHRPVQRLARYILRRRWKKLVRRQVGIALGDSRKGARSWMVLFPLFLVWKVLARRSRTV